MRRAAPILLGAILVAHLALLLAHFEDAYASPDASGYFVQAHRLLRDGAVTFEVESPLQYVGVPWLEVEAGRLASRYPPGLPVLLAAAWAVGGFRGALLLGPLLATASVGLAYVLARRLLGAAGPALAVALLLATVPVLLRQALHADAHVPALFVLLLATLALVRFSARPTALAAVGLGLAVGFLPAVRYAEATALLGPILFLWADPRRREKDARRPLLAAAAAAALPLAMLSLHHARTFGAPWRTGYDLTNEQTAFALAALADHLPGYLESLAREALGPFLPLGLAGLVWLPLRRTGRATGLLLLGVVLPLLLLYGAYYWGAPGDATNRFFLPALPFLLIAAVGLTLRLDAALARRPRVRRAARALFAVVVAAQAALGVRGGLVRLQRERIGTARNAAVARWLAQHAREGDVVVANRAVQGGLEPLLRYRLVDDRLLPGGPRRAQVRTRNPNLRFLQDRAGADRPSPHQADKLARLRAPFLAGGERLRARRVLAEMRRWAAGADLFWLATDQELRRFEAIAPPGWRFERIGDVPLPTPAPLLPVAPTAARASLPYWVPEPPLIAYRLRPP